MADQALLQKNLSALRSWDPDLADELSECHQWPDLIQVDSDAENG